MSIAEFRFLACASRFDTIGTTRGTAPSEGCIGSNSGAQATLAPARGNRAHGRLRRGLVLLALCLRSAASLASDIPDTVAAQLTSAGLPLSSLAFVVLRPEDGATLLSVTPGRPMQPASTLKLLTSAVALDMLGRAYRGRSELRSSAPLQNGTLAGDLVLRGLGDTDLDIEAFANMLQALRNRGVEEIGGDLLLDRSWMTPERPYEGVAPFDETPEFRYNVVPDAISLNANLIPIELVATADTMSVRMVARLHGVALRSTLTLIDRACTDWEDGWQTPVARHEADGSYRIELRGEFPRNCVATTQVNVLDRTAFADRLFRSLWRELGGRFAGITREAAGPRDSTLLAEHRSRPLSDVLRDINKRSDNPATRLTYLALASATAPGHGSVATRVSHAEPSTAAAARVTRTWLFDHGIDDTGLVLENGSGLSRLEKIQPQQLAEVLRVALRRPWAPEFLASLPVAGLDGGLQRRLAKPPLVGVARLKTGTLRDVTALAGYVPDRKGRNLIVVAMVNHPTATSKLARPALDALIEAVALIDSTALLRRGHGAPDRTQPSEGVGP